MITISLQDALADFNELITRLAPGEQVLITRNDVPIARLIGEYPVSVQPRRPGSAKGKLIIHAEDDEHPADFAAYLPALRNSTKRYETTKCADAHNKPE